MSFIGDFIHDVASGLKDIVGGAGEAIGMGSGSPLPILALPFGVGGLAGGAGGGAAGAAAAGGGSYAGALSTLAPTAFEAGAAGAALPGLGLTTGGGLGLTAGGGLGLTAGALAGGGAPLTAASLAGDWGFRGLTGMGEVGGGGGISTPALANLSFAGMGDELGLQIPSSLTTEGLAAGPAEMAAFGQGPGAMELWRRRILELLGNLSGGTFGSGKLGTALNLGSGLYGLKLASDARKLASQTSVLDPFGYGPRGQYASELSALRADPSRLTQTPGYKAGEQAVMRNLASQGYLGSGNMLAALADYGGAAFDRENARLAQLAGAGFAPMVQFPNAGANLGAAFLSSSALGTLGYGLKGLREIWG